MIIKPVPLAPRRKSQVTDCCSFFPFTIRASAKKPEAATSPSLDVTDSPQARSSSPVSKETDVKCRLCGNTANARFDPCGHVLACVDCATMLRKCFVCRVMHRRFCEAGILANFVNEGPYILALLMSFGLFFLQAVVDSFQEITQGGDGEESQCVVCCDEPPSIKFEPCGHMIACKGW